MLSNDYQSLDNLPIIVKQRIHAVNMYDSYYVMTYNTEIPYVANTLKKIHISITIFNEFASTYYDNKYGGF